MKVKLLRNVCVVAVAASMLFINGGTKAEVKNDNTLALLNVKNETIEANLSSATDVATLVPEGPIIVIIPRVMKPVLEVM